MLSAAGTSRLRLIVFLPRYFVSFTRHPSPPPLTPLPTLNSRIRSQIIRLKKEGRIKRSREGKDAVEMEMEDEDEEEKTAEEILLEKMLQKRDSLRDNPQAEAYGDKIKAKLLKKGILSAEKMPEEKKGSTKEAVTLGRSVDEVQSGDGRASDTKDGDTNVLEQEVDDIYAYMPEEKKEMETCMPDEKKGSTKKAPTLGRSVDGPDKSGDGGASAAKDGDINVLEQEVDEIYDELDDDDVDDYEDEDMEMSEEDLIELVAKKMSEKRKQKETSTASEDPGPNETGIDMGGAAAMIMAEKSKQSENKATSGEGGAGKTTTGIGGSWAQNKTATEQTRRPSRGSWGYFERPNDISKAYGGGKRVGAGFTKTVNSESSVEETRRKLQEYRRKVGIEVESEKEHEVEISEAIEVAARAMERGVYATAVSCLEKVTKYCSTNSKVGGKVFLELAMAYEAVGRTQEAMSVYQTLTTCRIEDIKFNAKRLLYGLEAMDFMRNEAKLKSFQKKKASADFIDATGFDNFAEQFDDRYNTAWINLDSGFYKQLTESVVRGMREARQIILNATGPGEVDRRKVVQALRSISRYFDDALEKEIEEKAPVPEPVAIMNGKPILAPKREKVEEVASLEKFILSDPEQMKDSLQGKWKLQLLADRRGNGVTYFNNTESWQAIDMPSMTFKSFSPVGFMTVSKEGSLEFDDERRVLSKTSVKTSGGGSIFSKIMSGSSVNDAAPNAPQQIVIVDGALLITKYADKRKADDAMKDFFCVWRRVME